MSRDILGAARFCVLYGSLLGAAWLGAMAERDGQDPSPLAWVAGFAFLVALGFTLFYWGARSATRRAAKDEEANR